MSAPTAHTLTQDAAEASEHVLKSAVTLARAEARLLLLQTRSELLGVLLVVVGTGVAVAFVGVCLLLIALSPVALHGAAISGREAGLTPFSLSLILSVALALAGGAITWFGARRMRGEAARKHHDGGLG